MASRSRLASGEKKNQSSTKSWLWSNGRSFRSTPPNPPAATDWLNRADMGWESPGAPLPGGDASRSR